jgi:acyl phosphate:glycerol-3-phosphate acyltransferase
MLLIIALVSYLLGSIPFGYLLVRVFRRVDVRHTGSGNIGATNVARTGSKGLAIATLLLDALKGYGAVWIAGILIVQSGRAPFDFPFAAEAVDFGSTLAGLFAIVGHMFPVWLGFKGGKGVATAGGAFLALAPRALLLALVAFAIVLALTRYVSLGSMVASAAFPLLFYWTATPARMNVLIAIIMGMCSLLIILRHKDNIRRLLSGTENRFR